MEHLAPDRCLLLVVDLQNDFLHEDGAFSRAGHDTAAQRAVLPVVDQVRDAAHQAEVPVVLVRVEHSEWTSDSAWRARFDGLPAERRPRGPVAARGSWGAEFYGISPDDRDFVITKHRYSAFAGTPLDLVLRAREASTLVIIGVQTDVCVSATARDATQLGFVPVVIEDAVATGDPRAHDAALEGIRVRLGPVVKSSEVITAWS